MKFKNLVTKKKSQLVELAREEGYKSPSAIKKNKLIKKLGDLNEYQERVLEWKSNKVKEEAKNLGLEYTNKAETQVKIANYLETQEDDEKEEKGSWWEEFEKACDLALRKVISKGRAYEVSEVPDGHNTFNVCPSYMKRNSEYEPLITISTHAAYKDKTRDTY